MRKEEREKERKKESGFFFRTNLHSAHILSSDVQSTDANDEIHKITLFTCSFCVVVQLGLSY